MKFSMPFFLIAFAAVMSALIPAHHASADLAIEFSVDGGATFANNVNVQTGESLRVDVFLRDDEAGGLLESAGLFGFGLTASTNPTNFGEITVATIDAVFDFNITEEFTASTIDWEDAVLNNSIPTGQAILLGMFQFDTILDGTSVFTFGDIQPGSGSANTNWLSGVGASLDEEIFGIDASDTFQFSLTSSSVPEPASGMVIGIGFLLIGCSRKRAAESSTTR